MTPASTPTVDSERRTRRVRLTAMIAAAFAVIVYGAFMLAAVL